MSDQTEVFLNKIINLEDRYSRGPLLMGHTVGTLDRAQLLVTNSSIRTNRIDGD